jgi:type IV secretory pathway VirD2 relaxase
LRGRQDRHQFRFIVSSEDGVELSDLRTTTREKKRRSLISMERRRSTQNNVQTNT